MNHPTVRKSSCNAVGFNSASGPQIDSCLVEFGPALQLNRRVPAPFRADGAIAATANNQKNAHQIPVERYETEGEAFITYLRLL